MRELDTNGLRLCEYQGKIFEKSIDRFDCSTAIFLRRFLHSDFLERLDKNNSALLSLDVNDCFDDIERQFGVTKYGSEKKNKEALFWVGYMYRYISYTRNVSTKFLFKTFDYEKLFELYQVYHTQDPEWCVKNILELYGLNEEFFDPNYRLMQALKKRYAKSISTT